MYRALVARISYLSQDRPDLKFASMRVCCAMENPSVCGMERVTRIGRYLVVKPRVECLFHWLQSGELEVCSDADWRGDKSTRRSVSAGVGLMRSGHCLSVCTKKQQVLSLVHRRKRAVRRSQNRIRRAGDPERGKGLGDSTVSWLNVQQDASISDVLGHP